MKNIHPALVMHIVSAFDYRNPYPSDGEIAEMLGALRQIGLDATELQVKQFLAAAYALVRATFPHDRGVRWR